MRFQKRAATSSAASRWTGFYAIPRFEQTFSFVGDASLYDP